MEGEPPPAALDAAGMQRIREAFAASARRAMRLGLDGIEIHTAHGYLLHEFLSPISNRRTDQYGGSLENRMRFPLEVFDAVRAAVPMDKPVGVKVSATDWINGGWDVDQTIVFARELKSMAWIGSASPQAASRRCRKSRRGPATRSRSRRR
jgi:2,4-dienoyl-CoA reductase-like NADH-dependent reductase (Old Yellow Enzyme family)